MTDQEREWYTKSASMVGRRIVQLMAALCIDHLASFREPKDDYIYDLMPPLAIHPSQFNDLRGMSDWDRAEVMYINGRLAGHFGNMALGEWTRTEKFQIALGALADIAEADDLSEAARRRKARRIYDGLRGDS